MTENPKRVLVVDDEVPIARVLRRGLSAAKYDVRIAVDGENALDTFRDFHPDLVITDLQMPEMGGLELCKQIRKTSGVPIIVLSVKGEERTKVDALNAGADDYVTKPFGMDELLARVGAVLRRTSNNSRHEEKEDGPLSVGDFSVDLSKYVVTVRDQEIHLTPKELELLVFLLKNHGRVLTHSTILTAVWGANAATQTEYLRVFFGNLRKKIEINPSEPKYIISEPWVGYRFNPSS